METKKCSKCGQTKPVDAFNKRYDSFGPYRSACKLCEKAVNKQYQKQYRTTNRKKAIEYGKHYYQNNKDHLKDLAKNYAKKNKSKIYKKNKEYSDNNREILNNKEKVRRHSSAKYIAYKDKLTIDESPRLSEDGILLEIRCKYCGKYFTPTNVQVSKRISVLNGTSNRGTSYLYCSNHCKLACPTFYQKKYPKGFKIATSREVQPELRQLTLARDNYTCQKCGMTIDEVQLHCHHILPINESPVESADVSNCITLCKECHQHAHAIPDCGYHDLKCSV